MFVVEDKNGERSMQDAVTRMTFALSALPYLAVQLIHQNEFLAGIGDDFATRHRDQPRARLESPEIRPRESR